MDCQFCNKHFSSKGNLLTHQRTTKYCLQIQEANKPQEFICVGCDKRLCTKYRLQTHQRICEKYSEKDNISKLKNIITLKDIKLENSEKYIEKLEKRIEKLLDMIVKIAMKSTKTINNISIIQQNFTEITYERLPENIPEKIL